MNLRGYKAHDRCIFLGWTEGERGFSSNLFRTVKKISKAHGGLDCTSPLKKHFDPDNIMNPGGTLGIDMTEEQKRKPKFCSRTWDNPAY
ncbi:hypothetical protein JO41_01085 [Treponema sp. OMZ 838]|uniref:hypothetical protein n=1 Tax=Treponema sp. OMZ 838 TaxID=1539298 RepID=UPI0005300EFE|nr:hypothetical protein [Treponema sp. OMZ 838]AIW88557.1 hypothetical protein JO41_01085 [Treponema sp. OMZ 838]